MSEFRTRFRELRKSLAITLREMSEDLGIPLSSISKYEQGIIKPGVEILSKLAKCYNVNLNWLIANQGLMFDQSEVELSTGTSDDIRVRLVKYSNSVKIQPISNEFFEKNPKMKSFSSVESEEYIQKISKDIKKPVTVEFANTDNDDKVKVFYPDGKVTVLNRDENSYRNKLVMKVKSKLDTLPYACSKLEFLDVAIDSLEDRSAFDNLKTLVKGMDIAINS